MNGDTIPFPADSENQLRVLNRALVILDNFVLTGAQVETIAELKQLVRFTRDSVQAQLEEKPQKPKEPDAGAQA